MNPNFLLLALALAPTTFAPAHAEAPTERPRTSVQRPRDRGELRRFLKTLGATPEQRAVALEQARAARPIARSARIEGRRIRVDALREHKGDRTAAREDARPRIRELRERTLESLRPMAKKLLATLTPDQKRRLEDEARARGRELDDARLETLLSWLLTRQGTISAREKGARR